MACSSLLLNPPVAPAVEKPVERRACDDVHQDGDDSCGVLMPASLMPASGLRKVSIELADDAPLGGKSGTTDGGHANETNAEEEEGADDDEGSTDEEDVYKVEKIIKKRMVCCSRTTPLANTLGHSDSEGSVCVLSCEENSSTLSSGWGMMTRRIIRGSPWSIWRRARCP